MKKIKLFLKPIQTIFAAVALIAMVSLQSCSSDSDSDALNPAPAENSVLQRGARPLPVFDFPVFSTSSDFISAVGGCYTVQVNVYLTYQGQTNLLHSSAVSVGNCGSNRGVVDDCLGEYRGFYILSDVSEYDSCLKDLLERYPDLFHQFKLEMESHILK